MIYLSDHQTITSQCAIPNAQSNLYWISSIPRRFLWDNPYANEQTCKRWRQQGFASGLSFSAHVSGHSLKKEEACLWGRSPPELLRGTFSCLSFYWFLLQVLETFLYLRINQLDIQSLQQNNEKKTAVELKIEKNKNRMEKKLKGKMSKKEKKVCQPKLYCTVLEICSSITHVQVSLSNGA